MRHTWLDRPAPPRSIATPATLPFPGFDGAIGMRELQTARKLLGQGLDLERKWALRIVLLAIDLLAREPLKHDDSCRWWIGGGCDCPAKREGP